MEIVNYLRVLRRRWQLVASVAILGLILGVSTTLLATQEKSATLYKATHTLISTDTAANLQQLRSLTIQGEVPKRVAEKVGGQSLQLASQIIAEAKPEIGMLQITAVASDPARAVQLADAFAVELMAFQIEFSDKQKEGQISSLKEQQAQQQLNYKESLEKADADPANRDFFRSQKDRAIAKFNELQLEVEKLQKAPPKGALATSSAAEAIPISGAQFLKLFETPTGNGKTPSTSAAAPTVVIDEPTPMGPGPRGGLGLAFGLFLGAALALVIERLDPRIRTKEDAEEVFGFPVVTETPPLTRRQQKQTLVLSWEQPRSRAAEAYRVLRSAVLFAAEADGAPLVASLAPTPAGADTGPKRKRKARVLMVSSASPSEGKTTTTANLAAVLGEAGFKVLVINCDFRRPKVHAFLGVDTKPMEIVQTEIDGVQLLNRVASSASLVNPAEVASIQRKLVRDHLYEYDIIVLDTAPLLTTNDAAELLPVADQVILVARAGKTTKEAADRTAELLDRRQAPVTGVCLIGATDGPGGRYYYYGAGRSYYLDEDVRRPDREIDHDVQLVSDQSTTDQSTTDQSTSNESVASRSASREAPGQRQSVGVTNGTNGNGTNGNGTTTNGTNGNGTNGNGATTNGNHNGATNEANADEPSLDSGTRAMASTGERTHSEPEEHPEKDPSSSPLAALQRRRLRKG